MKKVFGRMAVPLLFLAFATPAKAQRLSSSVGDTFAHEIPSAPPATPLTICPASGALLWTSQDGVTIQKLKWYSALYAHWYRVQISATPDFASLLRDTAGISDTSVIISGLSNNATYYWCVCSGNTSASSGWSLTSSFTFKVLVSPDSVKLVSPRDSDVAISGTTSFVWNAVMAADVRYLLQVATDSAMEHVIVQDSSVTDTVFCTRMLPANYSYWWRVQAWNRMGWGPFSRTACFFSTSVNVAGRMAEQSPFWCNSSVSTLRYSLARQCPVAISWYNVQGRVVYSYVNAGQGPGAFSVSPELPIGEYCMVFKAGDFVKTAKAAWIK